MCEVEQDSVKCKKDEQVHAYEVMYDYNKGRICNHGNEGPANCSTTAGDSLEITKIKGIGNDRCRESSKTGRLHKTKQRKKLCKYLSIKYHCKQGKI